MLDELKPNEKIISEGWEILSPLRDKEVPKEALKEFCLSVYNSVENKLPSSSIYR